MIRPSRLIAFCEAVAASTHLYSIAADGAITPLSLDDYVSLPVTDPRVRHVATTYAEAVRYSLRARGIETGLEVPNMSN